MRKRVLLLALASVLMSLCIPVFAQNDYVDLGLSVKWGTVNLGTTNLRPFGWYWTWADAMNIKTTDGSRLATKAEWNELLDYCTWEWTEKDGKTGYLITSNIDGYRDCSIFLPASGWLQDGNIMRQHSYGSYWTSTPGVQPEESGAYGFNFMSDGTEWHSENRFSEQSVRMVMPLSESELTGLSLEMGNFRMRQASVIRLNVTTADGKRIVNSACNWKSSDENVVSVMDDGLIVAKKPGACEITAMAYGKSATCTIHVTPYDIEFVDLGLGVLWATCNLGADKPSDCGDYYAWGEIEPKDDFYWGNYRYCSTISGYNNAVLDKYTSDGRTGFLLKADNLDRLEAIDDVASVLSGGEWYIPTSQDFEELKENCKWNLVKVKGVEGVEFESKVPGYEGKKIFIPYSGCMIDDEVKGLGYEFKLWSSTPSNNLSAYLDIWIDTLSRHRFLSRKIIIPEVGVGYINRFIGMNVRPVKKHDADMFSAISLADEHLDLHYGEIKPMVVNMVPSGRAVNEGNIVWSTSNADVAAVENGYLTAVGTGSCEITASSEGHEAKMTVTVTLPVPEPVDLGLSVKWASANLGASGQNEAGAFFAWGETSPKAGYYSGKNYKFGEYTNQMTKYNMGYDYIFTGNYPMPDYKETLDAEDDAAAVLLGDGWRMPTADELWELRTKCTWIKVQDTLNIDRYGYMTLKFHGYIITSNVPGYEGRSIFLPAAGRMSDYFYPSCVDSEWAPELCYWTSTMDQSLGSTNRFTGCNIRPVKDESGAAERVKPEPIKPLTHNAQVDLGLSVLWADCNLGAEKPWERGARIAWGETTEKTYFSLYNYKHAKAFVDARKWNFSKYTLNVNLDSNSYIDNKTSLDIEDDAAHVNWGGDWRMPTKEECMELFEKCEWKETTLNGVKGYRITSKVRGYTSNSIFLPCTSVFMLLFDDGNYYDTGCYMTSELGQFTTECVALYFDPVSSGGSDDKRTYYKPRKDKDGDLWSKIRIASVSRIKGAFIRPVCPR